MSTEILNIAEFFLEERLREGRGHRRAIRTDDADWTYAEISGLAAAFGHMLREAGVRPEERVIVALPDGPACAGALFGTLKLGAVLVIVSPFQDAEALSHILRYTRARAVVAHATHKALFSADVPLLLVGDPAFDAAFARAPRTLESFPSHPDAAAVWLFSGGTTGQPKAVVQSHASFVNSTRCYAHGLMRYSEDDITLSVPQLNFGYALGSNLLFPFSVGACAVLSGERRTPELIFSQIQRFHPTLLVNVPSFVRQMVEHPGASAQDLSCLRVATSAGEALSEGLHARWRETFKVELCDGLGTAEMWHIFLSNRPGAVRAGTLGQVVDGFEVRLCDAEGREVPVGDVGQLWVRGDSLAHGYWQRPEATRAAFRGPWYVSNDMLRRDVMGFFYWCARGDDLFKVSGRWFSPGEVEDCLASHPAVAEAVVVGVVDRDGLSVPVAFVVARVGAGERLTERLRDHLQAALPRFKQPGGIALISRMPRTHLGKVDRGVLQRLGAERLNAGRADRADPAV